jgi:hypothetical protein
MVLSPAFCVAAFCVTTQEIWGVLNQFAHRYNQWADYIIPFDA